jgi:hypothetical protein
VVRSADPSTGSAEGPPRISPVGIPVSRRRSVLYRRLGVPLFAVGEPEYELRRARQSDQSGTDACTEQRCASGYISAATRVLTATEVDDGA